MKSLGILSTHPIQYQAPWFRELARHVNLEVFFAHRPDSRQQGEGFGHAFDWDVDLLSGYRHRFLRNVAPGPSPARFAGCDTPEIADIITSRELLVGGTSSRDLPLAPFDAFIVNGWHVKSYWQAIRACRNAGVPVFVRGDSQLATARSGLKRWVKELAYPWLMRRFDGFLTVGQRNREYLLHYGARPEQIHFVPHFIDNEWFAARAHEHGPQRLGRGGRRAEELVVLFVGKLVRKKRPGDVVRAVAALRRSGVPVRMILVGSGELEPAMRQESAKLHAPVTFEGFRNQTELPRFYARADVLVLPSDGGETWGLVVNEAMACGCPAVVSQAVGCGPDLIDEGQTGFTFPLGDSHALAAQLTRILKMRSAGHDFTPALKAKMQEYSVQAAVAGTLRAIGAAASLN